jgi:hypothetical protein
MHFISEKNAILILLYRGVGRILVAATAVDLLIISVSLHTSTSSRAKNK